jgi:myo-inositol-1(or 4)-monophosphatase
MLGLFGEFISASRAVRRLGSAALDMCYVAAGRMDGFWERGLGAWDIAAGALLVEEAGGRVSDLDGGPFVLRSGRLVASNGRVHAEMLATIARYTAERARKRTL